MGTYPTDREWSDEFLDEIRYIAGPCLLVPATPTLDREQLADLMILQLRVGSLACRVRRYGFADEYPNQLTIRCDRSTGSRTELAKIFYDGLGDWFFYGHQAAPGSREIDPWWIVDLNVFRGTFCYFNPAARKVRHGQVDNRDGTQFKWFDLATFPSHPAICIDTSAARLARPTHRLERVRL